ncbi:MAG: hypothetical protein AUI14_03720 [Actinobacteria bacterium 13_2_20CM_2_71_6]|nr:MAG: hypothetical protein AUI14_03720 [Actinobacteria bacterium 13_2_20CM_2_71_6]
MAITATVAGAHPAGASAAPVVDVSVTTTQSRPAKTLASPVFSTRADNEMLVAFFSADGPRDADPSRS